MKSVRLSIFAFAIAAAFSAHATGPSLNQKGISNAGNVQAPPPANPGTTINKGIGFGVQSSAAGTGIGYGGAGGKGGKAAAAAQGGNARARGGNARSSASAANVQTVTVQQDGGGNGDGGNSYRIPVATAYAPSIQPTAPCMGSVGAGIQTGKVGLSFGGSTLDEGCDARNMVYTIKNMGGLDDTAIMYMCLKDDAFRQAMTATGRSCEQGGRKVRDGIAPVGFPVAAPVAPAAPTAPAAFRERPPRDDRGALAAGSGAYAMAGTPLQHE